MGGISISWEVRLKRKMIHYHAGQCLTQTNMTILIILKVIRSSWFRLVYLLVDVMAGNICICLEFWSSNILTAICQLERLNISLKYHICFNYRVSPIYSVIVRLWDYLGSLYYLCSFKLSYPAVHAEMLLPFRVIFSLLLSFALWNPVSEIFE